MPAPLGRVLCEVPGSVWGTPAGEDAEGSHRGSLSFRARGTELPEDQEDGESAHTTEARALSTESQDPWGQPQAQASCDALWSAASD